MNILFVCTGNTCRSPMAAGYLTSLKLPGVTVQSRGLVANGAPVSDNSRIACAEKGIDISGHISKQITAEDATWADKIICMSPSHKAALANAGVPENKLFVLGSGISDPYGGDIDIYRNCRDEIFAAIDRLASDGFFADFKILPMNERHIAAVAKLEKVCFSEPWSAEGLREAAEHGTEFFVAENAEHLLGYIGIKSVLDEGYITNVAVFPQYRKRGIATALINRVFELSADKKLGFVSLEVRVSNSAAIALYEKLGFKKEGERKNFYRDPRENALIMTKRF